MLGLADAAMRILLTAVALFGTLACVGDPPPAKLDEKQRAKLAALVVDAPPPGLRALDVEFSAGLRLKGYTLSPQRGRYAARQQLELTLVWQRVGPIDSGWRLFTHLLNAQRKPLANLDREGPLRAMPGVSGLPLPPAQWPVGKIVLDPLRVSIPATASGELAVVAGLFRGHKRSPAQGGDAVSAEQCAAVTKLTIAPAKPPAVKELHVSALPAGTELRIDGVLSEPSWGRAADTGPFVHPSTGGPADRLPVQGRAKLLWDAEHLYVAFEVKDVDVVGGWPLAAIDPHLWEKDTVEIMIDPDGDGDNKDYYEIQINPQNLVFDSRFDRYNQPRGGADGPFGHQDWSAELVSAVALDGTLDDPSDRDQGYTVEARIPWRRFAKARRSPPRPGDRWRMNFYAMQNNSGAAWSPILGQGNFHRAKRFGRIVWSGAPGTEAPTP